MKSGIYMLINRENKMRYIGSSNNLERRKNRHFYDFKANTHRNKYLQEDYNKGIQLEFEILEYCRVDVLNKREDYWKDKFNTVYPNGYNIAPKAGNMKDFKHSHETKKLMSIKAKGKPKTKEHRENIARAKLGNTYSRKLTLEQCFEIKKLLLKKSNEKLQAKDKRIALLFNINHQQIGHIRAGTHWSSKDLGGPMKEWL